MFCNFILARYVEAKIKWTRWLLPSFLRLQLGDFLVGLELATLSAHDIQDGPYLNNFDLPKVAHFKRPYQSVQTMV